MTRNKTKKNLSNTEKNKTQNSTLIMGVGNSKNEFEENSRLKLDNVGTKQQ